MVLLHIGFGFYVIFNLKDQEELKVKIHDKFVELYNIWDAAIADLLQKMEKNVRVLSI